MTSETSPVIEKVAMAVQRENSGRRDVKPSDLHRRIARAACGTLLREMQKEWGACGIVDAGQMIDDVALGLGLKLDAK